MKTKIILFFLLLLPTLTFSQSWIAGTSKLYVSPDSTKVGIGISSPSENLHVNGSMKIGNSTSASDRTKNLLKFGDGNYVYMGEWEADDMLSFKAAKYNFTNGKVGYGVTSPRERLDINGSIILNGAIYGLTGTFNYQSHPLGHYTIQWGSDDWNAAGPSLWITAYGGIKFFTQAAYRVGITGDGKVGIGTDTPAYKLDVNGTIRANEIIVNTTGADFVFDEDYQLPPLEEINTYVSEHKHLPHIPSAIQMQTEGVDLNKLTIKLLQKIEELTLYIIKQDERISELEKLNNQSNNQPTK